MIDLNCLRENPEETIIKLKTKSFDVNISKFLELDNERRSALQEFQNLRAQQQKASKEISGLPKNSDEFKDAILQLKSDSNKVKELEKKCKDIEVAWKKEWLNIPNLPDESTPVGNSSEDNLTVSTWGEVNELNKDSIPHYDIPGLENLIDFKRGSKVTGAGFPFFRGEMAKLVRVLVTFFLEEAEKNGYEELYAPLMVNETSAIATGQLPDKEGQMYCTENFYLIPTAEVPVTNFLRDEVLDALPKKFCAYTPCFRREAGSWGKDVRGLNRLHQFDKVELVRLELPEQSLNALESIRRDAEKILQKLELPYRVLSICSGDMGFPHSKQYDLEVWANGQKSWLEVSSCSLFTDFQARRANLRYRTKDGKLSFFHTLNGSALAIPRVLAAILENGYQPDGKIKLPDVIKSKFTNSKIFV